MAGRDASAYSWYSILPPNLRRRELDQLVSAAVDDGQPDPGPLRSIGACRQYLDECRARHREDRFRAACAPRKPSADMCAIPAAEINAWLRTLPPLDGLDP